MAMHEQKQKKINPAGRQPSPAHDSFRSPYPFGTSLNDTNDTYSADTLPGFEIDSPVVPRIGHHFVDVRVHAAVPETIQTKLTISQPGDVYEQEAERVAEQVIQVEASASSEAPSMSQNARLGDDDLFTRKEASDTSVHETASAPPLVDEVLSSGRGQPLDESTRFFMESRFGHDFSKVRVHTDERAAESARSVNALAYTAGQDVVFGGGQYNPRTSVGQRLLAHELTHVAQQEHVGRQSREEDLPISRPDEPAELEATVVARAVSAAMYSHPLGLPVLPTSIRHHTAGLRINRQEPASPDAGREAGHEAGTPAGPRASTPASVPASSATHPSARDVVLEFVPDETADSDGPLGAIHVKVKGVEVATFPARGGPPSSGADPHAPGHRLGPTPPGTFTLERGRPHISAVWAYSQIADGTPLRDTGSDVQFLRGGRWVSTETLGMKLSRDEIIKAEKDLHGSSSGRIPDVWDLNDFGKTAFWVEGTQAFVHTTPESELAQKAGSTEVLSFSHGCIHIKPTDRDKMIAKGFLQGGVTLKVHAYRPRSD